MWKKPAAALRKVADELKILNIDRLIRRVLAQYDAYFAT